MWNSYCITVFLGLSFTCFELCLSQLDRNCPADAKEEWSYNYDLPNGPQHWGDIYETCNGKMQSPIDIERNKAEGNVNRLRFKNYDKSIKKSRLVNNGHSVVIYPEDNVERYLVIGGIKYSLIQFHFHWGSQSDIGSEHKFSNRSTSMELHLVHRNEAMELAVVGVLYQISYDFIATQGLKPISQSLNKVLYKDEETEITKKIKLTQLIDPNCSIYRYNGSLTTPPCSEGVIWSVCKKKSYISQREIKLFRDVYSAEKDFDGDISGCKQNNNFRPVQPLNDRIIYQSFP